MTTGDGNTGIIEEFRANEGKVGGQFEGYPLILVHHVGAKSDIERVTPVGCFPQPEAWRSLHPRAAHRQTPTGTTT